ncbi:MAG: hypothetical protein JO112_19950 [Planctomycetes bacterium]|nr:hypothetical protein [Planctomycetota bacterium]
MSVRLRVRAVLEARNVPVTASELGKLVFPSIKPTSCFYKSKVSQVASALNRMVKKGDVVRVRNVGERGGAGYLLRRE